MENYRGKWLYEPEQVLFDGAHAVATVTLNRPDKRNALNGQMLKETRDTLLEADDRMDVNAIVLCGAGKDFCADYDLEQAYEGRGEKTELGNYQYRRAGARFDDDCFSMERTQENALIVPAIHKPMVAKVQGNYLAGGTDLALSCDLVIMTDDARIGFPATRGNGLPPAHI